MKVVFINSNFTRIDELEKDYPKTREIYQAFFDIETKLMSESRYPDTKEFLTEYGSRQVYLREKDSTKLIYVGNLRHRYLEATRILSEDYREGEIVYPLF